jgi:predicted enzyme related to lactoylglutathione lyase
MSRNGSHAGDISYISLALPDVDRGRAFYSSAIGWRFASGQVEQEGNQVDEVLPQIGLWACLQPTGRVAEGAVLAFRVDDIPAAVERVRQAGGTATEPAERPYGLEADCTDDQGLKFYLHQLPGGGRPAPANGGLEGDVSYVSLLVPDLERSRTFFAAVLGWSSPPGLSGGIQVTGTTPMIGLSTAGDRTPGAVLSYRVDDIEAAVSRVRDAGGTATDPVDRQYALEADCTDDQGIPFYLHQFAVGQPA